jgi:hypothetical protein
MIMLPDIRDQLVRLASLIEPEGRKGFVDGDMVDVDAFAAIPSIQLPDARATSSTESTEATRWPT